MSSGKDEYVSVIFGALVQPIADLFGLLESCNVRGPNPVQASSVENGYSVSIIVLADFMVESALNRTRYVRQEEEREHPVHALRRLGAGALADDAEEVLVLRDVIAHNHLWRAQIEWNEEGEMRLLSADLLKGYGDEKFKSVVDMSTRRTRRLGLDVFPTRMHRGTAVAVMKKCAEILHFLEGLERRYVYLEPVHVFIGEGRSLPFYAWASGLRESA